MLKLELVRFSFSPVVTYGVMHSRDGWSCFTRESVVLNTVNPPKGKAALVEGLYRVNLVTVVPGRWSLNISDHDGELPVSQFVRGNIPIAPLADINVGLGLSTITGVMFSGSEAILELLARVKAADSTYLNIRHLDNTQLLHFERMAREAIQ